MRAAKELPRRELIISAINHTDKVTIRGLFRYPLIICLGTDLIVESQIHAARVVFN